MKSFLTVSSCILIFCFGALGATAQRNREDRPPAPAASASPQASAAPSTEPKKEPPEQPPVVTHHEVHVGGKTLRYTATAGMMPLQNADTGETEAHIFYIAYTLDGQQPEHRP